MFFLSHFQLILETFNFSFPLLTKNFEGILLLSETSDLGLIMAHLPVRSEENLMMKHRSHQIQKKELYKGEEYKYKN